MPVATHQGAHARRRAAENFRHGADVVPHGELAEDLIRPPAGSGPFALRSAAGDRAYRARLHPGTAILPGRPAGSSARGVTVGLASRPIVLRSVGVAHPIPANVPWVVASDAEWRVTVTEAIDLRLVHTAAIAPHLVATAVAGSRPTRFVGREGKIVGTAIRSATPVWIDSSMLPVKDLGDQPRSTWRLVGDQVSNGPQERDLINAFLLMLTWAFEHNGEPGDPRLRSVVGYINTRLSDPSLSTGTISEDLRISRRTLQGMFEAHGGVAIYIRRQRLAAALHLITSGSDQVPRLDGVAELTGLGSRRTLERAMRQVYGLTPRQARAHLLAGHQLRELPLSENRAS